MSSSPEQKEFREYCRGWLRENMPAKPEFRLPLTPLEVMTEQQRDYLVDWQSRCHTAGLVGCDFPEEYGGRGESGFQTIANQEMDRAKAPFLINIVGLSMAAPTILHHGTEEQKRRFLPAIFSAEHLWCQGFSEPGAGSDLANQRTFARAAGDDWVINGHKVWTTMAHFGDFMITICRTDDDHKYKGLTYFIVPVAGQAGVTVIPLIKMTGESGFNEVFLDDVTISDDYRLGAVGAGWSVAMTTLLHERGAAEGAGRGGGLTLVERINRVIELAKSQGDGESSYWDSDWWRGRIMRLLVRAKGIEKRGELASVSALVDNPMRIAMQRKLLNTELLQDITALACEMLGYESMLYKHDANAVDDGGWPLSYLNSYGSTIAAGTSEIQRNILAERVLGLPKSK